MRPWVRRSPHGPRQRTRCFYPAPSVDQAIGTWSPAAIATTSAYFIASMQRLRICTGCFARPSASIRPSASGIHWQFEPCPRCFRKLLATIWPRNVPAIVFALLHYSAMSQSLLGHIMRDDCFCDRQYESQSAIIPNEYWRLRSCRLPAHAGASSIASILPQSLSLTRSPALYPKCFGFIITKIYGLRSR